MGSGAEEAVTEEPLTIAPEELEQLREVARRARAAVGHPTIANLKALGTALSAAGEV